LRADDESHRGPTANDLCPLRLGDTAGDGNIHPASGTRSGLLEPTHASELGEDFLLRLFANVAGIQNDEIRILRRERFGEAFGRERVRHTLGIVDVHLTTEGLDVDLAVCAHALLQGVDVGILYHFRPFYDFRPDLVIEV